jgi:hypothetical protein
MIRVTSVATWTLGAALAIASGYASEAAPAPGETTVSGLRVLDRTGGLLMSVGGAAERGVKFYGNGASQVRLALLADSGGEFMATATAGGRSVRLTAEALRFTEQAPAKKKNALPATEDRLMLGAGKNGSYSLLVFNAGRKIAAGVGATYAGSGMIVAGDASGASRAMMHVNDGKGRLAVVDERAVMSFAHLTVGNGGAGRLEITDPRNVIVVEAGVTSGGLGVVRAGPRPIPTIGTMGSSPSVLEGR